MVKYGPTDKAKKNPAQTFVDGVRVGIGGKLIIKRGEGKPSTEVPEATAAQYERLKHLRTLVKVVEGTEPEVAPLKKGATLTDNTGKAKDKTNEGNRKSATSEPATPSDQG